MSKKNKPILALPFYALLAGFLPALVLWQHNVAQIKPTSVFISLGITALFILVVCMVFLVIFRSLQKTGIIASLFFLLFFSFGHVYTFLESSSASGLNFGFWKLSLVYGILLAAGIILTIMIKRVPKDLVLALNIGLILLVVYNVFSIARFQSKVEGDTNGNKAVIPGETKQTSSALRNVYYIIFDSYAREDVLQEVMGYDNSKFIDSLEQRGFYVAECANANYDGTLGSLTSSLNYGYLEDISGKNLEITDDPDLINAFKDNHIRKYFSSLGYTFVTARGFSSFNDINDSDIYLNYRKDADMQDTLEQVEFANLYLRTTVVRVLYELYDMDPVRYNLLPYWLYSGEKTSTVLGHAAYWYYQTNYMFDALVDLPEQEGPYFVYAHFNPPHGPYVFDDKGGFRYVHEPTEPTQYYLDTVTYLNTRILTMIDEILEKSETPPIIVIQGDHAPQLITEGYNKHKILNAYYFPDGKSSSLYSTITPVNTFRVILKEFFNEEITPLPDYIYVKLLDQREQKPSQCTYP